jgi:hypothetical protein
MLLHTTKVMDVTVQVLATTHHHHHRHRLIIMQSLLQHLQLQLLPA